MPKQSPVYSGKTKKSRISNSDVGTEFVKLLPKITDLSKCKNRAYAKKALTIFNSYENILNNIRIEKFDKNKINNINYICSFMKEISRNIFDNISSMNYPGEDHKIPRRNHGGLNALRSLLYGINVIKIILESDKYKKLSPEQKEIFNPPELFMILMISPIFQSILRIDEKGGFPLLCKLKRDYYKKLFPGLNYKVLGTGFFGSPHQIALSVLYKVIIEKAFSGVVDSHKLIELSRAITYHWGSAEDHLNINGKEIEDLDLNKPNKNFLPFFIYHVLMTNGHYLDHCRGRPPFSKMINNDDIKKLLDLFKISKKKISEIVKLVIETLKDTEFNGYESGKRNSINAKNMEKSCNKLQGRYENPKFESLSLNFDKCWKKLNFNKTIKETLNVYFEK